MSPDAGKRDTIDMLDIVIDVSLASE